MLFESAKIGTMTLKNRIVKSATVENMADATGLPTAATKRFYERVAKGGSGLIIAGFAYISEEGKGYPLQHSVAHDEIIPEWQRITSAVHEYGAKIAMQIGHVGRQKNPRLGQSVAPSKAPNLAYYTMPRVLTETEIRQIIDDFALAAARVKAAGFDAVQLHAAHGYLISGFLSPLTNRRRDRWGGSRENRFRFLEGVYLAVREAVGPEYPILCKLNMHDFMAFGLTPKDSFYYAKRLAELNLEALEISGGIMESFLTTCRGGSFAHISSRNRDMFTTYFFRAFFAVQKNLARFREAYFLPYAVALKPMMHIPLILVGGIRSCSGAEEILAKGQADFISIARPLILEPDLPKRWQENRDYIPKCISCNHCAGEVEQSNVLQCYMGNQ